MTVIKRKPQINFQVDDALKILYDEAKESGYRVARFCAAGLLLMVEDPQVRARALDRLRAWEEDYADASVEQVRAFVRGAQDALRRSPRDSGRGRSTRPARKTARRAQSD